MILFIAGQLNWMHFISCFQPIWFYDFMISLELKFIFNSLLRQIPYTEVKKYILACRKLGRYIKWAALLQLLLHTSSGCSYLVKMLADCSWNGISHWNQLLPQMLVSIWLTRDKASSVFLLLLFFFFWKSRWKLLWEAATVA